MRGEAVATLPCRHFYHPACIAQWLQHQKARPYIVRFRVQSRVDSFTCISQVFRLG